MTDGNYVGHTYGVIFITSSIIIRDYLARVLFDSSSTYSFLSTQSVQTLGVPILQLDCYLKVSTPTV
jgi:hypothetical protein